MAVSQRTRFEVLRRDAHTCRYCGSSAPDVKLTVDHVTPVALGGTDDPANLVAACADCNAGKSSTSPDEHLVAQAQSLSLEWSEAMRRAAAFQQERREIVEQYVDWFGHIWNQWTIDATGEPFDLPGTWRTPIRIHVSEGLTADDIEYCIETAMAARWVDDRFSYCMGVCRNVVSERADIARSLMGGE